MIRRLLCTLVFTLCGMCFSHGQSQYAKTDLAALNIPEKYTYSVDSLADYIYKNFPREKDKIRAIYIWIVHNLKYNVYITYIPRDEAQNEMKELERTLKNREGVCRQFAMLFCYLAEKVGIPAYTVDGYGKSKGVLLPDPHEWCVAKVNAKWYLYDPTFDMGYVFNYQFIPRPSTNNFQLSPQEFIQSHMPFDPMWQLLLRPYSYQEFDSGIIDKQRNVPIFQYTDSITAYAHQSPREQLITSYTRVLKNGKSNRLVDYYLAITKANIEVAYKREVYNAYKEILHLQDKSSILINKYMEYRKTKFKPLKKANEVKRMIEEPEILILKADSLMNILCSSSAPQYKTAISNLKKSITQTAITILYEKKFIETYYATKPAQRSLLFQHKK